MYTFIKWSVVDGKYPMMAPRVHGGISKRLTWSRVHHVRVELPIQDEVGNLVNFPTNIPAIIIILLPICVKAQKSRANYPKSLGKLRKGLILWHRCAMSEENGSFYCCYLFICSSGGTAVLLSASLEAGADCFVLLDFRSMTAAGWSVKPQWTRLLRLWKSWQGSTNLKPSSGLPAEPDNCSGQMWGKQTLLL